MVSPETAMLKVTLVPKQTACERGWVITVADSQITSTVLFAEIETQGSLANPPYSIIYPGKLLLGRSFHFPWFAK